MMRNTIPLLLLMLASCAPAASTPTLAPTVITLPSATVALLATDTVAAVGGTSAVGETPATGSGLEAILIASPGGGAAVTSPVTVQGQSRPTFEQNLVVAVYGEDGGLLAQQATTIDAPAGSPGNFSATLDFSVATEQAGRISVYETSAMDGGIVHLASVEVILRPSGSAEIIAAEFHFESIAIASPAATAEISGGVITVSGYSDYYFESNLGLVLCGTGGSGAPNELCGTEDNVLASGNALIDASDIGQAGPFNGQLTYSVAEPTPGRIVVFAASPRDGGLLHVSSIPITLLP